MADRWQAIGNAIDFRLLRKKNQKIINNGFGTKIFNLNNNNNNSNSCKSRYFMTKRPFLMNLENSSLRLPNAITLSWFPGASTQ